MLFLTLATGGIIHLYKYNLNTYRIYIFTREKSLLYIVDSIEFCHSRSRLFSTKLSAFSNYKSKELQLYQYHVSR